MKPIIVIQDDFSTTRNAVSSMKGMIKTIDPSIDIEDGTHDIEPFNIWMAAQELETVESCWPKGTIFVSVVDPGVGSKRRACAAKLKDANIVNTPDNGTLSLVAAHVGIEEVREIDETVNRSHSHEDVSVFDGRDLFSYFAGKLAAGRIDFTGVGPAYDPSEIVVCPEFREKPLIEEGHVVTFISHALAVYGGIRLAVANRDFEEKGKFHIGDIVHVRITRGDTAFLDEDMPFARSFADVEVGKPLLYKGSSRLISVDLNQANLMHIYNVHAGIGWKAEITKVR